METGFLNKHDSEYFSTDGFEQSNGFESENSFFSVFTILGKTPETDWIIPDEICSSDKPQKPFKEDFRKTFQDWQQHLSSLQSRDEPLKEQILCSPIVDDLLPDIFGTPISIPIDKIKSEPCLQEDNLIMIKTNGPKQMQQNIKVCNDLDIKSLLQHDKYSSNDIDDVEIDAISIKQEEIQLLNAVSFIEASPNLKNENKKDEMDMKDESNFYSSSPSQDMPILSPEGTFQPNQVSMPTLHPPKLEISANTYENYDNFDNKRIYTTDLGPDNYEVVEIKVEQDDDDDEVNINTPFFCDTKPVIEAANLDTLLEQFEASATVSNNKSVPKVGNGIIQPTVGNKRSSLLLPEISSLSNKKIKASLPREVIDRIKDSSSRKKGISVVPAARLPAKGYNHMKDPGATKNKFSKLTSAKRGETVKLDHDYCNGKGINVGVSNGEKNASFASPGNSTPSHSDHSSKKDSGLESGDVSDCSSEPSTSLLVLQSSSTSSSVHGSSYQISSLRTALKINSEERKNCQISAESHSKQNNTTIADDIKSDINKVPTQPVDEVTPEEPKKKRKLNLEEYRSRRKNIKTKPVSPIISFTSGDVNGFRKLPEVQSVNNCSAPPTVNLEVQTKTTEEKKEVKKRDSSKDRRSSRPLSRYRRRTSSSSSSSGSRSRSRSRRQRRERSRRRRYSRGRSQRSRSRTRSSSSSHSHTSSSSISRSRSRNGNSKYYYRSSRTSYRRSNYNNRHSRYSPERSSRRHDDWSPVEKMRQIEERRVIYVGQIEEGTTKSQLRERFETFGPVIDISLHFRERGDNYGFVTFAYKGDAYKAVEHGNEFNLGPHYDICFGGRRGFCKQRYSDLDGTIQGYSPYQQNPRSNDSFDLLLREAQEKIRKQKHV